MALPITMPEFILSSRERRSVTGSLIVVSCGENDMLLYKENLDGEWIPVPGAAWPSVG